MTDLKLDKYLGAIESASLDRCVGKIISVSGLVVEATGCRVQFGEAVEIVQPGDGEGVLAEVVGVKQDKIQVMPYGDVVGLSLNGIVVPTGKAFRLDVSEKLLGRVIDPLGRDLTDDSNSAKLLISQKLKQRLNPMDMEAIKKNMHTGVKCIDAFTPIGEGQRIGLFSGAGVGKSTLLGMIARYSSADVIVIALVGERAREVKDFIELNLGESGLKKSVVVVSTAGDPAIMRRRAAESALDIAEWFRDSGANVLLVMDSISRFAIAQREIGIATEESLGARGYPASVFAKITPIVERCGSYLEKGSITLVCTVLVEGDDFNEPVSDYMRSILDGHIVLSRALANMDHFPAIDPLKSLSRLTSVLQSKEQKNKVALIRKCLSDYEESKDILEMGLYKKGTNQQLDKAISFRTEIMEFLSQDSSKKVSQHELWDFIERLVARMNSK